VTRLALTVTAAVLLAGCAATPPPTATPSDRQRATCGWEWRDETSAVVTVGADGNTEGPLSATRVIGVVARQGVSFGQMMAALEPHRSTLVRVKVVLPNGAMLPMTLPRSKQERRAELPGARVAVVGKRILHRPKNTVAQRFADLRLDGERAYLCLETEGCRWLETASLSATLRAASPPVRVFALTASDPTPWSAVVEAVDAVACYDRAAGEEPHEVLLAPTGKGGS